MAEAEDPVRAYEEERRLAYVAWTRARRSLTLLYDPAVPSPFLLEAFTPDGARPRRYAARVTYLPSLGRRGEGWVAIQAILLALVAGAGSLGPAWAGEARLITSAVGAPLMLGGLTFVVLGGRRLAANRALTPSPIRATRPASW